MFIALPRANMRESVMDDFEPDTPLSSDLGNACAGLDQVVLDELRAIALTHDEASGLIIKLTNWAGQRLEGAVEKLPRDWQSRVADVTELALTEAYRLAFATRSGDQETGTMRNRALAWAKGERWHKVASALTGALGGLGGLPTTILDLPVTTTLILRSIQEIAIEHGEDVSDPAVRAQCVSVFGLGGPLIDDDHAESGLIAARVGLTGSVIAEMLKAVLPRFGMVVSQKLLAQATPVLGAAAGAAINTAFASYYQSMAHVHFRLRKLERAGDAEQIRSCFERIARAMRVDGKTDLGQTELRRLPQHP